MANYTIRYAANWSELARQAKRLTAGKCCLCDEPATEVHHALYKDKEGAIAGREIPGVHVFPLCDRHHSNEPGGAHHRSNWRRDKYRPELGNKNTPSFYTKLRQGWLQRQHLIDEIKGIKNDHQHT
ncbi:MAG: hypothetical protein WBB28_09460 [Crinalium sp.]